MFGRDCIIHFRVWHSLDRLCTTTTLLNVIIAYYCVLIEFEGDKNVNRTN